MKLRRQVNSKWKRNGMNLPAKIMFDKENETTLTIRVLQLTLTH